MQVDINSFGKWRRRFWPIHSSEIKKLLPLIVMKFLISAIYITLTTMKDAMVITAHKSGAEVVPILKGWVVLPASILMAYAYTKLSSRMSKEKLFYTVLGGFLAVIFLYGFFLYPNREFLTPTNSANYLVDLLGPKAEHWVAVYRNWIQSLLFITAELWGTTIILVAFWGLANDITSVSEAKRAYSVYITAGNSAIICMGFINYNIIQYLSNYPYEYTVKALIGMLCVFGCIVLQMYRISRKNVKPIEETTAKAPKKKKVSFLESLKHICTSKYLMGIAMLVIGYGLMISLVEISWKAALKDLYPTTGSYQAFITKVSSYVGISAFLGSLLLGNNLIRKFGWHFTAQITPVLVGLSGVLFFVLLVNKDSAFLSSTTALVGLSPLLMIALFGAFQNVLSKTVKYTFFDPTKEMAYIPLDNEEKVKSKASIDMIGSRLGKSGSSWIQVALFDLLGTGALLSISHILLPIVFFIMCTWMLSVRSLNKGFLQKQKTKAQDIPVTDAK